MDAQVIHPKALPTKTCASNGMLLANMKTMLNREYDEWLRNINPKSCIY
jgi:hypothetical protein